MVDAVSKGKCAFKFENMWLESESFLDLVQGWWSSYVFTGSPSFVLAKKLKALKEDLKIRNKEVFGDIGLKKKHVLNDIMGLDEKEFGGNLSVEDRSQREILKIDLDHLAQSEEIF